MYILCRYNFYHEVGALGGGDGVGPPGERAVEVGDHDGGLAAAGLLVRVEHPEGLLGVIEVEGEALRGGPHAVVEEVVVVPHSGGGLDEIFSINTTFVLYVR